MESKEKEKEQDEARIAAIERRQQAKEREADELQDALYAAEDVARERELSVDIHPSASLGFFFFAWIREDCKVTDKGISMLVASMQAQKASALATI